MKKYAVIVLILFATFALGQTGITGSSHDFSGESWNSGEICITCHTPHNASSTEELLWNHGTTATTFTLYSSTTFSSTGIAQPSGSTKLCLSCHDGTVAIDNFGGASGSSMLSGSSNLGTDLGNDHPVSFPYEVEDGLKPLADVSHLLYGTNNTVECASCHDVHNGGGYSSLLVVDNTGSALCLTCHEK